MRGRGALAHQDQQALLLSTGSKTAGQVYTAQEVMAHHNCWSVAGRPGIYLQARLAKSSLQLLLTPNFTLNPKA